MKRILTLLTFVTIFSSVAMAQNDLSVTQITAPVSGCALTATQNVTIKIFNFGATLPAATTFNVSYTINAGVPVTQMVTLASPLTSNSTLTFTFTTQANLSTPGTYTFDASVSIAGDVSPANDAFTGYVVTNTAPTVGGTITGPSSVCVSGNSGNLTLTGYTATVLSWEYSTDGGFTWITTGNSTAVQPYNNLTAARQYRVFTQNGGCSSAYSAILSIAIDPASVGGTLNSNATVCTGSNSGTLTLTGKVGNVVQWEKSTDGGITWSIIPGNTTTSQAYLNLVITTKYRVRVLSGTCAAAYSTIVTITVAPNSVGGTINPHTSTACSGANAGTLTLGGQTGTIAWEFSIDNGITWNPTGNSTTTQNYLNIVSTRLYRARIQSNPCSIKYSDTATVTVTSVSVGGSIAPANSQVCTGINSGTLTLGGNTGTVTQWEYSTDGGITWTIIPNTTTTNNYTNLVTTTMYRALVQNGGCTSAYSATATVTVNPTSVGGTISGGTTVCASGNSGTLTLSGQTGSVVSWESSTDHISWTPTGNTTTTQAYNNLTLTTYYQAIIQSGVCTSDTAIEDTVIVDPVTVGGTIAPAASTVCSGLNAGTLTLGGNTGNVVQWEYSTDGGVTWIIIINTATTQAYNNITTATIYRALVKSGVCSQTYSSQAVISVTPQAVGGTLYSDATVCGGANSGTLTLVGFSGSITQWESSMDNGLTWSPIANTSNTNPYLNLIDTTLYRVLVNSGVCPTDTSTVVTITVDAPSVGGTVTMDDTVCAGVNAGTLTLSGHTGNVVGWEYSTDGGVTWINISNTTTTQGYSNLMLTTMYRARVGNGVCPSVTSVGATITVDPIVNGGTVTGSTTVCATANSGSLMLTGSSGTVVSWETSTDGGLTWTPDGNTTTTENYTNLTDTTWYRAILMSGVCGNDTSSVGVIMVDPPSVGGIISANAMVCAGVNGGTIYLTGDTGAVLRWEFSIDGGGSWMALSNTTDSLVYTNLTQTTEYRAVVQSGVCSPAVYSSTDTITVSPLTVGGTITGSTATCEGTGNGVLTLTGYVSTILGWETSTDGGLTWSPIPNNTATQNWSNPADTVWYHVLVTSGICPMDTSSVAQVIVYPKPVAGFTAPTVCQGNPTVFTDITTVASGGILFHQWDFADNNASVATSPSHTYGAANTYNVSLIVISDQNCSDTVMQNVIVNPNPSAVITSSASLTLCSGDSTELSVASSPQNHYLWSNGVIVDSVFVSSTGTYVVTVTDTITGCTATDSTMITVLARPTANAGIDTVCSAGSSIVLMGSGGSMYTWSPTVGLSDPSAANPTCTLPYTVTYTLTVTDFNGCSDTDAVKVTFVKDYNVVISNLITANGDGYNDVWNIQNIEFYPENKVSVYNRNGMLVFEQEGYNNSWMGTFNGTQLPDGTYYYVLQFTDSGDTVKGAVTLISDKK